MLRNMGYQVFYDPVDHCFSWDEDSFVPCWMCEKIYANCASQKEKLIVHGAGHCESHYMATEEVENKLTEFLDSVL